VIRAALVVLLACLPSAWAEQPLSVIAFGSCADQEKPQPFWETILARSPDLFLYIGDTDYADTRDMEEMRAAYRLLGAQPGYRKLKRHCPILATWDDHDYGENDAGAEYPKKIESERIFLDFFDMPPDAPRRERPGVYHVQHFGPPARRVQVILLDTRYFRSPLKRRLVRLNGDGPYGENPDPGATLLGAAQWAWLEEQLRRPARLRLIASSIQVLAHEHHRERWGAFPHERQRLFRLIRETGAERVLFISGDRHHGELSRIDGVAGYPLYDLTASGLNVARGWRDEPNRYRVGRLCGDDHFGLIRLDWNHHDPIIFLELYDTDGERRLQEIVRLSALQRTEASP